MKITIFLGKNYEQVLQDKKMPLRKRGAAE
jgi:hypothetical protein